MKENQSEKRGIRDETIVDYEYSNDKSNTTDRQSLISSSSSWIELTGSSSVGGGRKQTLAGEKKMRVPSKKYQVPTSNKSQCVSFLRSCVQSPLSPHLHFYPGCRSTPLYFSVLYSIKMYNVCIRAHQSGSYTLRVVFFFCCCCEVRLFIFLVGIFVPPVNLVRRDHFITKNHKKMQNSAKKKKTTGQLTAAKHFNSNQLFFFPRHTRRRYLLSSSFSLVRPKKRKKKTRPKPRQPPRSTLSATDFFVYHSQRTILSRIMLCVRLPPRSR